MNNKVTRNTYRPIFPTPAGLVVSIDAAGKPNIITLGEIFNLSIREPVWVGIAIRETVIHGNSLRNRRNSRSIYHRPSYSTPCGALAFTAGGMWISSPNTN